MENSSDRPVRAYRSVRFSRGMAFIMVCAALVITTAGIRVLGQLLGALFFAVVLVIMVFPVRAYLDRRGAPPWLSLTAVAVSAYGILLTVAAVMLISVLQFVEYAQTADYSTDLTALRGRLTDFLNRYNLDSADLNSLLQSVDLGAIAGGLMSSVSGVVGIITSLAMATMVVMFVTLDSVAFQKTWSSTVQKRDPALVSALNDFAGNTRRYFGVNSVFGLIVAVINTILLFIVGVPLALVWGTLSFFTSFIPNIGFFIGLIPPAILALLAISPTASLIVIIAYIVINFIVDSVLKPRFVGEAVGLSTTLTFMSLLFWSWVFGPVGALLAVPLTLFLRAIFVDSDPESQWIRQLIAGQDESGENESGENVSGQNESGENETGGYEAGQNAGSQQRPDRARPAAGSRNPASS